MSLSGSSAATIDAATFSEVGWCCITIWFLCSIDMKFFHLFLGNTSSYLTTKWRRLFYELLISYGKNLFSYCNPCGVHPNTYISWRKYLYCQNHWMLKKKNLLFLFFKGFLFLLQTIRIFDRHHLYLTIKNQIDKKCYGEVGRYVFCQCCVFFPILPFPGFFSYTICWQGGYNTILANSKIPFNRLLYWQVAYMLIQTFFFFATSPRDS